MSEIESSSFSPGDRLLLVPLARLRAHPANANVMPEELLTKLAENISREGDYPPLVIRNHPTEVGCYEILDGHQRATVLPRIGHALAHCYLWNCDDQTALTLIATLNRLEGQDDPRKRAELIAELAKLASVVELARLLPEDEQSLSDILNFASFDLENLLSDLQPESSSEGRLRSVTFALTAEDEAIVEEAVGMASGSLDGKNRRGRALAAIARAYLGREGP